MKPVRKPNAPEAEAVAEDMAAVVEDAAVIAEIAVAVAGDVVVIGVTAAIAATAGKFSLPALLLSFRISGQPPMCPECSLLLENTAVPCVCFQQLPPCDCVLKLTPLPNSPLLKPILAL